MADQYPDFGSGPAGYPGVPPPPPAPHPSRLRPLWWILIAIFALLAGGIAFIAEDLRLHVSIDIGGIEIQDLPSEKPSLSNLGGLLPSRAIIIKLRVNNGSVTPIQIVDVDCKGNVAGVNLLKGTWAGNTGNKPLTISGHSEGEVPLKFSLQARSLNWQGFDLIVTGRIDVRVFGFTWNFPVSRSKPITGLPDLLRRR